MRKKKKSCRGEQPATHNASAVEQDDDQSEGLGSNDDTESEKLDKDDEKDEHAGGDPYKAKR